ncbi:MAG TPA: AAA family ATPase [Isosphaeraceae bacterium]|nr:AAA family ATPase [Isosphaeraceae bacterium]
MQAFLISDHESLATTTRQVLLRAGLECPPSNVVGLHLAAFHLTHAKPEIVLLLLPDDAERGLALLADLKTKAHGRLLVAGPAGDVKLVLKALRLGAHDYLDEADIEAELTAVLARWRADRAEQDQAGRVIAVLSPSGGSGSSTLAANVATVLAKEHESSALVDLKLQAGDLAALMDLKPTHTLADLCQNVSRLDRVLFERTLTRHASGVHLLASPLSLSDTALVNAEGVRQALALAKASFPYVVVDLDHSLRDEQMAVLRQADVILLVLRLDFASLRNARRYLDHLRELGLDMDRVRLVVNRFGQPKEIPASKAEDALGVKIAHFVPEDAKSINRSNNNGVPVVLEAPSAKVSKSMTKLAISVNGQHKKSH